MSKQESDAVQQVAEDDEPDDWDKRIFSTGCADENAKLTDCYFEKKDWRQCTAEVRRLRQTRDGEMNEADDDVGKMERFKSCWKQQGNDARTDMKDA
ncbi:CHCH domain-containing protein [Colletotrichum karsti]|uniref:CHCH domain-containing protein n=1 Tax=Colletotrichum karsti TaxID=1095194 RepID=A0A9P6LHM3_9PEZI|nr:CHCH domain-containing protein [Colletotrichum karsti]KAF9873316.1 CHCH domain-containing protein [Colletotrichum karsti]